MNNKTPVIIGLSLLASSGAGVAMAEESAMPPRQVLLERKAEVTTGRFDTKVIRIVFPKGYKTPPHAHDGPGPRYVVKGRVRIDEGGKTQEFGPGEVFWESGSVMTAENVSDGEAEVIIFEVDAAK